MIRDQFGQEIKIGDIITYPGRQGSDLWMRSGVVSQLHEGPPRWDNEPTYWATVIIVVNAWDTLTKQRFPKEKKIRFKSFKRATVVDPSMFVDYGRYMWQQTLLNVQERITGRPWQT